MALNWYWSEHLGTVEHTAENGQKWFTDLYRGNALLIEVYTNPETDCYNLVHFWGSEQHAKNCRKDDIRSLIGCTVRLIMKAMKESYKQAECFRLFDYLLDSGGTVELI